MQLLTATVRYAPETKTAASGREYSSVAVSIPGEQQLARIFAGPGYPPLMALQPGQEIRVARDSRDRLHLVEPDEQQAQPAAGFMGFQTAPAPAAAPVAQHQQAPVYQAAPAAAPAPAAPASPILDMADQWAIAFARLVAAGVPPEQAGAGASCCMIQTFGRR